MKNLMTFTNKMGMKGTFSKQSENAHKIIYLEYLPPGKQSIRNAISKSKSNTNRDFEMKSKVILPLLLMLFL